VTFIGPRPGIPPEAVALLAFWFDAPAPPYGIRDLWFKADPGFDAAVGQFTPLYDQAAVSALGTWEAAPPGTLALVLLLDQAPRNIFRGTARAFATDGLARAVADRAIRRGFDRGLTPVERLFLYLPFEHSEQMADQQRSLALFEGLFADDPSLAHLRPYVVRHLEIIDRFGRFPHRNTTLGRSSTPEEEAFLRGPNSRF